MSDQPRKLTRADLASFLGNNQRAIRVFEQLLEQVAELLPSDIIALNAAIADIQSSGAQAEAKAQQAIDSVARFNLDSVSHIGFNQGAAYPVAPGQIAWNADDGTLNIGMGYDAVTQQVGLETYYRIKASATITDGQLIMFDGAVGASGVLKGKPTTTGLTNGMLIMGIATMDIANNGFGYVTNFGLVRGIDTTGSSVGETWADGDLLYYNPSVSGAMTNVEPTAPSEKVIAAAVVNAGAAGSGSLFVRPNVLLRLKNLSDVYAPSPADGELLRWNNTNSRWENYAGASGTFTTADAKTVTVTKGIITSIV